MKDILGLLALSWGLVLLVLIGIAFLVVVPLAVWYAKKHGRSKWRWGIGAFLLVYLPIFWDWIPTVLVHKYYCEKEAGFWVYKTLDQWKVENPGVMEMLTTQQVPPHLSEGNENDLISTTFWNSRIKSTHKFHGPIFLHVWRREDVLVDTNTEETLALYVDYSTSHERRQAGWSGWKFWLASDDCIGGRNKAIRFVEFVNQFKGSEK